MNNLKIHKKCSSIGYMTSSSPTSFDPKQYKTTQRQGWDSVAKGWQKWWKNFEVVHRNLVIGWLSLQK